MNGANLFNESPHYLSEKGKVKSEKFATVVLADGM